MLQDKIALYNKVREARATYEKNAAILKEKENQLKGEMLAELSAAGVESISEGGFTIFKKHSIRAEVTDHDLLQENMFALMCKAHAEGRPLQDGLLLQRTVAKNTVLDLIHSRLGLKPDEELDVADKATIEEADKLGLRLVDITDIAVRKK